MIRRLTSLSGIALIALGLVVATACDTGTGEPETPTPGPPDVAGTITLDAGIVAEPTARLWVGFFTEDSIIDPGIPEDPDNPAFGVQYPDPETVPDASADPLVFPFSYLMEGQVGTFRLIVGLDQNDDGLFCEGEWLGFHVEDDGNGGEQQAPVNVPKQGIGGLDVNVEFPVLTALQPDECP